ncbi:MAG: hypothetical protein EAZ13_01970 [Sphingobacteriia bacterium]|nr:MAG: hypothetical protein EAZ13_01970 [Sphingobacteriia bacterium]
MTVLEAISAMSEVPISTQVLLPLLNKYKRPYDKIDQLVQDGWLTQIKRGLYTAGAKIKSDHPDSFLIANHLYGPSYISASSALSFWGLIPEKVMLVQSTATRTTKSFNTKLGTFEYIHCKPQAFRIGLNQVRISASQTIIIATAEKALCDLIIQTPGINLRSNKQTLQFLEEDQRMNMDAIFKMQQSIIADCIKYCPKPQSLQVLLKTIQTNA